MTAEDLDLLREKILQLCRAAGSLGLGQERILRTLQRCAFDADAALVDRELTHLQSAGLLAPVQGASLTPALARFATTASGNHELERRGLL